MYLVEIGNSGDVDQVDDRKVLHTFGDRIQRFVHRHTLGVPVVSEANHNDAVVFRLDGLVDVPTRGQMGKEIGHGGSGSEGVNRDSHTLPL